MKKEVKVKKKSVVTPLHPESQIAVVYDSVVELEGPAVAILLHGDGSVSVDHHMRVGLAEKSIQGASVKNAWVITGKELSLRQLKKS